MDCVRQNEIYRSYFFEKEVAYFVLRSIMAARKDPKPHSKYDLSESLDILLKNSQIGKLLYALSNCLIKLKSIRQYQFNMEIGYTGSTVNEIKDFFLEWERTDMSMKKKHMIQTLFYMSKGLYHTSCGLPILVDETTIKRSREILKYYADYIIDNNRKLSVLPLIYMYVFLFSENEEYNELYRKALSGESRLRGMPTSE